MKKITIATDHTTELIDITSDVKEGICLVFTPHTTGSIFLFENAAAHLKSARMGASVTVPVVDGPRDVREVLVKVVAG